MDMGIDTFLISSTVVSVLAQRLVRVLCSECRLSYTPDQYELDALGVRAENMEKYKFYKPVGCARCNHMGYRGRTGVHEMLLVNDMIRDAILARKTSGEIRRAAREASDLVTMREDGFYKVLKGVTSFEEVSRVVPWQEIDEGFLRSPEEIIALAEVDTALVEKEPTTPVKQMDVEIGSGVSREKKVYRSRFNTRTIAEEREKMARFFHAYCEMMAAMGHSLEPAQLMEDFIDFMVLTARRVERSLHGRFVEFSLRENADRVVMELETMVPSQAPIPSRGKPRKKGPRLVDFLLPPRTPKPATPEADSMLSLIEGKSDDREKTGLYQKHIEELEWKTTREA
jgi:type IV pilus assembly protein PilB